MDIVERLQLFAITGALRDDAISEIERLRAALKECSDDLESELRGRYDKTLDYPSQRNRFDRDMKPVVEARKLLG